MLNHNTSNATIFTKQFARKSDVNQNNKPKNDISWNKESAMNDIISGSENYFATGYKTGTDFIKHCLTLKGGAIVNSNHSYEKQIVTIGKNNYSYFNTKIFTRGFTKTLAIGAMHDLGFGAFTPVKNKLMLNTAKVKRHIIKSMIQHLCEIHNIEPTTIKTKTDINKLNIPDSDKINFLNACEEIINSNYLDSIQLIPDLINPEKLHIKFGKTHYTNKIEASAIIKYESKPLCEKESMLITESPFNENPVIDNNYFDNSFNDNNFRVSTVSNLKRTSVGGVNKAVYTYKPNKNDQTIDMVVTKDQQIANKEFAQEHQIYQYVQNKKDASLIQITSFQKQINGGRAARISSFRDSLMDIIIKDKKLTQDIVTDYTQQLLSGALTLYKNKIQHGDPHLGNIKIKDDTLKFLDWGHGVTGQAFLNVRFVDLEYILNGGNSKRKLQNAMASIFAPDKLLKHYPLQTLVAKTVYDETHSNLDDGVNLLKKIEHEIEQIITPFLEKEYVKIKSALNFPDWVWDNPALLDHYINKAQVIINDVVTKIGVGINQITRKLKPKS
jgi:hypothetical protein